MRGLLLLKFHVFLFAVLLAAPCFAQVDRKGDIDFSDKPLSEVLKEISMVYDVQFAYSSDRIDLNRRISVQLRDADLRTVLQFVFRNTGITYSIEGRLVTLEKIEGNMATISGTIRESGSGELLIGAMISTIPAVAGSVTNAYGFYSLTLPAGVYTVQIRYFGYKTQELRMEIFASSRLDISLESAVALNEVVVKAASDKEMHTNQVDVHVKEIEAIPAMLGEKDVVKYISLMPGVQKGNEGNSYLHVRGGAADQNLILIDDAVIYNAYHYLGLASLFTGSELKNATLIKGAFSAKYGGRISSVLDMSSKDGSKEKYGVDASAGFISSRILLEGPIRKNSSSFLISLRRSYLNQASRLMARTQDDELNYRYTDLHVKVSTDVFRNSRLFLSAYAGQDQLITATDPALIEKEEGLKWGNQAFVIRWNQLYGKKFFSNSSLIYSSYANRTAFGESGSRGLSIARAESFIHDYSVKHDMDYIPGNRNLLKAGLGFTYRLLSSVSGTETITDGVAVDKSETASSTIHEVYVYAEDEFRPYPFMVATVGLRLVRFDSEKAFPVVEPRLRLKFLLRPRVEIVAGYARMNQFMHMISPMGALGIPIEQWTASGTNILPQTADVYSLGVCRNDIQESGISVLVEGYYKQVSHMSGLREGTSFLQVVPFKGSSTGPRWDHLVTQGNCTSFGGEFMLKQTREKMTWWISYTISKTLLQFDEMNRGLRFPATYDRTHDLGIFLNLRLSGRLSFSSNFIYGTGNAISLPVGEYFPVNPNSSSTSPATGAPVYDFENKNTYRMRDYSKLDVSLQYMHLIGPRIRSTIELSVYNVLNRANPFYYQITNADPGDGNSRRVLTQTSLFPIMPSLSWNVKF